MMTDQAIADLVQSLLPAGGSVLDVGCGNGDILALLVERGMTGVGVDPRPHSRTAPCQRLRAEEIDTLDAHFDVVYAVYALHHFDDPHHFLQAARRVLVSDGVLLIVDWIEGARTGVSESYLAPETVARWMAQAGFDRLQHQVHGQTMTITGRSGARSIEGE